MNADIKKSLAEVNKKIGKAAEKSGRDAKDIQLIVVTKTKGLESIKKLLETGYKRLGENRVQEIREKAPFLPDEVQWHMIGRLQSNKVKHIIDKVELIHSLDRWSLAEEIQKRAERNNITVPVLVQVNQAGEDTKTGLQPNEVFDFLKEVNVFERIKVEGLMTIAPFVDNPEEVRHVFRGMKDMFDWISGNVNGVHMRYLSMGMTGDYEIAIEEGANMVRIGSAIFGPRQY